MTPTQQKMTFFFMMAWAGFFWVCVYGLVRLPGMTLRTIRDDWDDKHERNFIYFMMIWCWVAVLSGFYFMSRICWDWWIQYVK